MTNIFMPYLELLEFKLTTEISVLLNYSNNYLVKNDNGFHLLIDASNNRSIS